MSTIIHRILALVVVALLATLAPDAQANRGGGGHVGVGVGFGHHHFHHGHWGWGVGVGIGLWPAYPYGWGPGYVVVEQPVVYGGTAAMPPAPSFIPKSGQSAAQTEADRRQCDREAMGQPAAMADASIFHRMVLVCMENRGYTVR